MLTIEQFAALSRKDKGICILQCKPTDTWCQIEGTQVLRSGTDRTWPSKSGEVLDVSNMLYLHNGGSIDGLHAMLRRNADELIEVMAKVGKRRK